MLAKHPTQWLAALIEIAEGLRRLGEALFIVAIVAIVS